MTRGDCLARDASDPLANLRSLFDTRALDAENLIYLDGNSLGALPAVTAGRVRSVVEDEWGAGLIRSWNRAGWVDLATRVAGKIARLVGAADDEVVVTDSTTVNLFKVLSSAADFVEADGGERVLVTERSTFPSDLYVADTLCRQRGFALRLVDADDVASAVSAGAGILLLTHVNYRTGRLHPMAELSRAAHAVGALAIWDLAHSAGAVDVALHGTAPDEAADFAVGCGYKFLNGGPGAPAFLWMHPRHAARMDRENRRQPLAGWFSHADPFAFSTVYAPAAGARRFLCGTPPILSLAALECGVDTVLAAEPLGGMVALRAKSRALTDLFAALVTERCAGHGLTLASPAAASERGSQVCFSRPDGAYAIVQALIVRGVIGDFRAPDILRFGFAPLYLRFVDVWDAVDRLATVLRNEEWRHQRFTVRGVVT